MQIVTPNHLGINVVSVDVLTRDYADTQSWRPQTGDRGGMRGWEEEVGAREVEETKEGGGGS